MRHIHDDANNHVKTIVDLGCPNGRRLQWENMILDIRAFQRAGLTKQSRAKPSAPVTTPVLSSTLAAKAPHSAPNTPPAILPTRRPVTTIRSLDMARMTSEALAPTISLPGIFSKKKAYRAAGGMA